MYGYHGLSAVEEADTQVMVNPDDGQPLVSSDGEHEEITTERWMFSTPVAQQIFSIVPGVAGGLAGFLLALKLSDSRTVRASEVLLASGVVAAVTFAAVFIVRTVGD